MIIDDPDIGEDRSYFITGQDAKYFEVDSNGVLKLKDNIALDYEILLSDILFITVTVIESQGFTAIQSFSIQVINTIDSPTNILLTSTMVLSLIHI